MRGWLPWLPLAGELPGYSSCQPGLSAQPSLTLGLDVIPSSHLLKPGVGWRPCPSPRPLCHPAWFPNVLLTPW